MRTTPFQKTNVSPESKAGLDDFLRDQEARFAKYNELRDARSAKFNALSEARFAKLNELSEARLRDQQARFAKYNELSDAEFKKLSTQMRTEIIIEFNKMSNEIAIKILGPLLAVIGLAGWVAAHKQPNSSTQPATT